MFFYRLGEFHDRTFEQQRYRTSGLNPLTATIVLWNTAYLERATTALATHQPIDVDLLQHLSPLGRAHINLTGDYTGKTRYNQNTSKLGAYWQSRILNVLCGFSRVPNYGFSGASSAFQCPVN